MLKRSLDGEMRASTGGKSMPLLKKSAHWHDSFDIVQNDSNETVTSDIESDETTNETETATAEKPVAEPCLAIISKPIASSAAPPATENAFTCALKPFCRHTLAPLMEELLASAPIAHRPMSKKKCTIYMPKQTDSLGNSFVLKGPYRWPEQASLVCKSMFRWSVLSDIWNDAAVDKNYSLQRSAQPETTYFIVSQNVSRKPVHDWQTINGDNKLDATPGNNSIVDGKTQGLKPFHKWLASVPQLRRLADLRVQETIRIAFLHILYRFVIGIGDLSMNNLVVNHLGQVRGVDFDDDIVPPPQRIGVADRRTVLHMLLRGGACAHMAEASWSAAVRAAFVHCCQTEQSFLLAALDSARSKWRQVAATASVFAVDRLDACDTEEMLDRLDRLRDALADKRRFADDNDGKKSSGAI
jgi:hypothetical protein